MQYKLVRVLRQETSLIYTKLYNKKHSTGVQMSSTGRSQVAVLLAWRVVLFTYAARSIESSDPKAARENCKPVVRKISALHLGPFQVGYSLRIFVPVLIQGASVRFIPTGLLRFPKVLFSLKIFGYSQQ